MLERINVDTERFPRALEITRQAAGLSVEQLAKRVCDDGDWRSFARFIGKVERRELPLERTPEAFQVRIATWVFGFTSAATKAVLAGDPAAIVLMGKGVWNGNSDSCD